MSGTVPDLAGVVVGWRSWQLPDPAVVRLRSPLQVATEWPAGRPVTACCELRGHPAPDPECTCGLYAARTPSGVGGVGFGRITVLGLVALWGTVVEGERGWRAATGLPVLLFCGPALPGAARDGLSGAYGVSVHRLADPVALTVERTGIDAAAERVRLAACGTPPDADHLDDAARAYVAAAAGTAIDQASSPARRRPRRRFTVGTALLAGLAASAFLIPVPDADDPPDPPPGVSTR